jgi:hypothetical protein
MSQLQNSPSEVSRAANGQFRLKVTGVKRYHGPFSADPARRQDDSVPDQIREIDGVAVNDLLGGEKHAQRQSGEKDEASQSIHQTALTIPRSRIEHATRQSRFSQRSYQTVEHRGGAPDVRRIRAHHQDCIVEMPAHDGCASGKRSTANSSE